MRTRPMAQRNRHTCRAGGAGDASAAGCMMASFDPSAPASERPGQEQTACHHLHATHILSLDGHCLHTFTARNP